MPVFRPVHTLLPRLVVCTRRLAPALLSLLVACTGSHEQSEPVPAPVVPAPTVKVFPVEETEITGVEILPSEIDSDPSQPARALLGVDQFGNNVYLSAYAGQVVVASYWASWCPPCWREMPELEQIYQEFGQRGVVILAVNFGESSVTISGFLDRQSVPLTFQILTDARGEASRASGVLAVPTTRLYNAGGELVHAYTGLMGFSGQKLRRDIESTLSAGG